MEKRVKTDDLFKIIEKEKSIENYISPNNSELLTEPLCDYLNRLSEQRGIKRSVIMERSFITKPYFYKLFSGEKVNPSRDILIQLCFGFSFTLDESQVFLKYTRGGMLYPRDKRDSIIIFALQRGFSVIDCNEVLYEAGVGVLGQI